MCEPSCVHSTSSTSLFVIPFGSNPSSCSFPRPLVHPQPGAFTPTCHVNHIPAFVQRANEFKSKGYDAVYIIAQNDPFVMSAFGRVAGGKEEVHFATDAGLAFSEAIGATVDMSAKGFGVRTGRYAVIIEDGKIKHLAVEPNPGEVTVSGADHVLSML